jgi:hypothetical protein
MIMHGMCTKETNTHQYTMQDGWYDETFFHCMVVQYLIMVICCVLTIHMYLTIGIIYLCMYIIIIDIIHFLSLVHNTY